MRTLIVYISARRGLYLTLDALEKSVEEVGADLLRENGCCVCLLLRAADAGFIVGLGAHQCFKFYVITFTNG